MKRLARFIAAFAMAGVPLAAHAQPSGHAEFDVGNIEIGFKDGYWSNDHHWHRWQNHHETQQFREHSKEHYHQYTHDRDPDERWHQEH
jgi:Ni/Co efflux regulator RcnB